MEAVLWFIKADLVKRPLRSILITVMAIIGVVVLLVMLSISNAGFELLQNYLKLFKPNMIVVLGPALPVSPLKVASIPHVKKVITLLITDAYLQCGKNYTYVMLIGFYNFTQLTHIVQVQVIKGNPSGLMVPPSLSQYYGHNCSLILPFLGQFNLTVTGVAKAPTLQSVLGKSKIAFAPYMKIPGATPNSLVILVDKPKNVDFVLKKINELTGGQAYIFSQKTVLRFQQLIKATSTVVSLFVGTLALSIVSIALAVTMMMDIRSRSWEIGLLKALGYTSRQLALVYLAETLTYAIVALIIGTVISTYLVNLAKHMFVVEFVRYGFNIQQIVASMSITPDQLALASFITVGMMVLSAALPMASVYRLEPVQALRTIE
ncbi:hypothetical protein IPA_07445 [Ignicoccus pacificus DSM 13166]|uniref:ABC3 transporter permease C-terminal domain-containing protein n=1 Tax=Ignicoccus pacificus DSM 13166 TaxID=940294 RepID=A0A977PL66_9CREN|nr:hypothetical protein IPA_07445 [Ignicoccus pacificus DSM 13166]